MRTKNILYSTVISGAFVTGILFSSCIKNPNEASSPGYNEKNISLSLSPSEYVAWVRNIDNGLRKEKTIEDLTFSVQYKPYPYIVCLEEKKNTLADSIVKNRISGLDGMQYFDLKIALNASQGELLKYKAGNSYEYDRRVKYFAFEMQKDIRLLDGTDTLPCALFHFERTYDVAPYSTFLLGFTPGKDARSEEKTLIFYDRTFGKGTVKFTFRNIELTNIPKLKTL
ncbi:MAG TPA: hypothetical protein VFC34_09170 [Puia sp.]|nr:hypothetical protein [Puia sp.]